MVQTPPASSNKCGTRQDEEATQAEDSGSQNGVRFQPAGTEGTGRCKPGHWAEAVTFLKPGNPQKVRLGAGGHAHPWDSQGEVTKRIQNVAGRSGRGGDVNLGIAFRKCKWRRRSWAKSLRGEGKRSAAPPPPPRGGGCLFPEHRDRRTGKGR